MTAETLTDVWELYGDVDEETNTWHIKLENKRNERLELQFRSSQEVEVTIKEDVSGKRVYRYSDGQMFAQALQDVTIEPGESKEWKDEIPKKLEAGTYQITYEVKVDTMNGESPKESLIAKQHMTIQ